MAAVCCRRVMPIGYLSDQGLLNTTASPTTVPGLRGDAQAAANFFGDICAANNNTAGPVLPPGQSFSAKWADLCAACKVSAPAQHVSTMLPSTPYLSKPKLVI